MTVLGDNPDYLMNILGYNLLETFGGQTAPVVLGVVLFAILAYLALAYKLDRGALTFLGVMVAGLMISITATAGTIPLWWFWGVVLIAAPLAVYGILNMLRQGEG